MASCSAFAAAPLASAAAEAAAAAAAAVALAVSDVSEQEAELAAACLRAVADNAAALSGIKTAAAASRAAAAAAQQGHNTAGVPPRLPIEQLVTAFVKAIFETQVRGRWQEAPKKTYRTCVRSHPDAGVAGMSVITLHSCQLDACYVFVRNPTAVPVAVPQSHGNLRYKLFRIHACRMTCCRPRSSTAASTSTPLGRPTNSDCRARTASAARRRCLAALLQMAQSLRHYLPSLHALLSPLLQRQPPRLLLLCIPRGPRRLLWTASRPSAAISALSRPMLRFGTGTPCLREQMRPLSVEHWFGRRLSCRYCLTGTSHTARQLCSKGLPIHEL